eukprot:m.513771 g.513771  ORF g.513771 m.513771 type:complete len:396 (-) comp21907_c0_seq5:1156-2343(-)
MATSPTGQGASSRDGIGASFSFDGRQRSSPKSPTELSSKSGLLATHGVVMHSGWIIKRGGIIKSWRQRYLVIATDGFLRYFKSDLTNAKPRGELDLRKSFYLASGPNVDQAIDWPPDKPPSTRIQLGTVERNFYLVAANAAEATNWLKLLMLMHSYATKPQTETAVMLLNNMDEGTGKERSPCSMRLFLRVTLLAQAGANAACFDCGLGPTTWVCCNLGVFLCMRCAGLHRILANGPLGESFCDLKSVEIDCFTDTEVMLLEHLGTNAAQKDVFESLLDPFFRRPAESNERMLRFVRDKYQHAKYAKQDVLREWIPMRGASVVPILQDLTDSTGLGATDHAEGPPGGNKSSHESPRGNLSQKEGASGADPSHAPHSATDGVVRLGSLELSMGTLE